MIKHSHLTARDKERLIITRCVSVAEKGTSSVQNIAENEYEAHMFRLASILIEQVLKTESEHLKFASDHYFMCHPNVQQLKSSDFIQKKWIVDFSRFKTLLIDTLSR